MRGLIRLGTWCGLVLLECGRGLVPPSPRFARRQPRTIVATIDSEPRVMPIQNYYDYRRRNDGIVDLSVDESAEEDEDVISSSPVIKNETVVEGDVDISEKNANGRADGQSHYQMLHFDRLRQGVMEHLQNIVGLGETHHEELKMQSPEHLFHTTPVNPTRLTSTHEWHRLQAEAEIIKKKHLRDLLGDSARCEAMCLEESQTGVFLDWSRQKVTPDTMRLLYGLARRMEVDHKMDRMRKGRPINSSERRAVLHFALRASLEDLEPGGYLHTERSRDHSLMNNAPVSHLVPAVSSNSRNKKQHHDHLEEAGAVDIAKAVRQAIDVRERVLQLAQDVRSGTITAPDKRKFQTVLVVGIGGSYLGPEFVVQAVQGKDADNDLDVRFVANVDPTAFATAQRGIDPKTTLVIIVSKSFTTAETMRNAHKVKRWILDAYDQTEHDADTIVASHMIACAARGAIETVKRFGIREDRLYEFWSWVGGRYSSSASAGLLPLALARGPEAAREFLDGARKIDAHFFEAKLERNLPVVMAMLGIWNVNFLGLGARAVVPYAHSLARFPAHVQQLEMESNGKSVTVHGIPLDYTTGEIVFGEPGTNAQHSFFQLLHMGQCVPCDFIGFMKPQDQSQQQDHDELFANLLAQPDALALGRAFEDVVNDVLVGDVDDVDLCPHKTLSGDRPSLTLLFPQLDPSTVGALLALYEHRTAIQGFVWNINSFDQFGVELGKVLATDIRTIIANAPNKPQPSNPSTARILKRYAAATNKDHYDFPPGGWPNLLPRQQHHKSNDTLANSVYAEHDLPPAVDDSW